MPVKSSLLPVHSVVKVLLLFDNGYVGRLCSMLQDAYW